MPESARCRMLRAFLVPVREQLRWLNLAQCGISDIGLQQLDECTHLTRLHLENTSIGDVGIGHLSALHDIVYLNLYGTKVTDAALPALLSRKKLKNLYLWKSNVTRDAVLDVRVTRPDLVLSYGARYEDEQRRIWKLAQQFHLNLLKDTQTDSPEYHSMLREFQTALREVERTKPAKQEVAEQSKKE